MPKKKEPASKTQKPKGPTFQRLILDLQEYWSRRGCVLQQPYDVEVGAGTMHPETFFRVLGPNPYRVAYIQPSRRPADGRFGENPNRLYKHTQLQVILKPPPSNVQNIYLDSLRSIGIDLRQHDIRFEEDNWESPTLGAWGVGWQVLLDGLEITQFTYFQQSGGLDLDPVSCELTYGLERIAAFLQDVDNVFQLRWSDTLSFGDVRLAEEEQFSTYSFELADAARTREMFDLCEKEARAILSVRSKTGGQGEHRAKPILAAYDFCLKCSHLFNILDARGAISTTERATLIGRVRNLSCQVAAEYCVLNGWGVGEESKSKRAQA
ncbi:MAG TPA: glycine--tRNA ligase subunit alpha [Candidatus Acidoferrales bacterium]|nr:glycine--tRNA ligase subunit alpha [Candidatus Acidoferrales bacterium]